MQTAQTIIGIDLGTTNSALAYSEAGEGAGGTTVDGNLVDGTIQVLQIPQLSAPGRIERLSTLPSCLYLPHTGELTAEQARLPWETEAGPYVAGLWARIRGTEVPERLIASAKSWLCNGAVDRESPLLPWKSDLPAGRCSPIEASRRYLEHLLAAFAVERGSARGAGGETVVLTVPASFDEVARNLTYEAARRAGLTNPVLLEEPLAAFYAWLAHAERDWREQVAPGDVVLVCDVGGGTTDFSIIAVTDAGGQLELTRVAVGDHLLLGGDNMDLALAFGLRRDLEASGRTLDHWQFLSLVGAARAAKERLLSDESLDEAPVAVASRGSSLFAGTVSTRLTREQVTKSLTDGFFPLVKNGEMPLARRSVGIQEFGLAYESDPAISRHLARFLRRAWQNVRAQGATAAHIGAPEKQSFSGNRIAGRMRDAEQCLMPTAVLFNGGVFNAPALRERVKALLADWNGGVPVKELAGAGMDLAVARGAAYYGKLRATGRGIRVQSGTARSYYVGVEEPRPAVPGYEPPVKGLCLVPQGTGEGTETRLGGQPFGLVVGEPVEFRFFSSAVRAGDQVGAVVEDATAELDESARLSITLPAADRREGDVVPVHLDAVINEVGVLKLYMQDVASGRKWDLEFNVRPHEHG